MIKNFQTLDDEHYQKLYLFFLMHNEKFFHTSSAYNKFHSYNIFNITTEWELQYKSVLLDYLYHKYNLPILSSDEKDDATVIERDLLYLRNHQVLIDQVYQVISNNKDIPIGVDSNSPICYVNQEFIENSKLQKSSFFDSIENYSFNHSYLGELVKTGENPFTRTKIDSHIVDKWISYFDQHHRYNFPLSTIHESFSHFPYLFDSVYILESNQKYKISALIDYIEKFFYINHPYNHIHRLQNMKSYEIRYISYILIKDTSLFPRFQNVAKKPNILTLLQTLLYYCKHKYKYINVIYFFS